MKHRRIISLMLATIMASQSMVRSATTCPNCTAQAQALAKAADDYQKAFDKATSDTAAMTAAAAALGAAKLNVPAAQASIDQLNAQIADITSEINLFLGDGDVTGQAVQLEAQRDALYQALTTAQAGLVDAIAKVAAAQAALNAAIAAVAADKAALITALAALVAANTAYQQCIHPQ